MIMQAGDLALVELGRALQGCGYRFVTITPDAHARFLARERRRAANLRDVFGWNLPFSPELLPRELFSLARSAGAIDETNGALRATVRFSSLGDRLFVHSGFPTLATDAVFFGPDTYRFCAFVARSLRSAQRLVDVGCGTGAGGLLASDRATRVVLADVSGRALRHAAVNAALAGVEAELVESDVLNGVSGSFDAVIANPPYLRDGLGRTYRDGGGCFGEALSVRIVQESLARLAPGGQLVLYTGAPVVEGRDLFRSAIEPLCAAAGAELHYEELDPDVFSAELDAPVYAGVERLAAIGMIAKLRRGEPTHSSTVGL